MSYICQIDNCGKLFKTRRGYLSHQTSAHGIKPSEAEAKGKKPVVEAVPGAEELNVKVPAPAAADGLYHCIDCGCDGIAKGTAKCPDCGEQLDWTAC